MRRVFISTAAVAMALIVARGLARRAAPRMRTRCHEMCARMLDEMPDWSPVKRIEADLDALRSDTSQRLTALEQLAAERV